MSETQTVGSEHEALEHGQQDDFDMIQPFREGRRASKGDRKKKLITIKQNKGGKKGPMIRLSIGEEIARQLGWKAEERVAVGYSPAKNTVRVVLNDGGYKLCVFKETKNLFVQMTKPIGWPDMPHLRFEYRDIVSIWKSNLKAAGVDLEFERASVHDPVGNATERIKELTRPRADVMQGMDPEEERETINGVFEDIRKHIAETKRALLPEPGRVGTLPQPRPITNAQYVTFLTVMRKVAGHASDCHASGDLMQAMGKACVRFIDSLEPPNQRVLGVEEIQEACRKMSTHLR